MYETSRDYEYAVPGLWRRTVCSGNIYGDRDVRSRIVPLFGEAVLRRLLRY